MTVSSRDVLTDVGQWLPRIGKPIARHFADVVYADDDISKTLFAVTKLSELNAPTPVGARQFELTPWRAFAYSAGRQQGSAIGLAKWAEGAEAMLAAVLGTAFGAPHFFGPYCEVEHMSLDPNPKSFDHSVFQVRWADGFVSNGTILEHLQDMQLNGRRFKIAEVAEAAFAESRALFDLKQSKKKPHGSPRHELERLRRALEGIRGR